MTAFRLRKDGYVYIVKSTDGLYKVGGTGDFVQRVKQLSKNGIKLEIKVIIKSKYHMYLEKFLHLHLSKYREYNEWYRCNNIVNIVLSFVKKHGSVFEVKEIKKFNESIEYF